MSVFNLSAQAGAALGEAFRNWMTDPPDIKPLQASSAYGSAQQLELKDYLKHGPTGEQGIVIGTRMSKTKVKVKLEPKPEPKGLMGKLLAAGAETEREEEREVWEAVRYASDRHACLIAPSRTGKGTSSIIPTLLDYAAGSVVCIDPKGQNAAVTARRRRELGQAVYCLNPFGLHTGAPWKLPQHRYNPLADIDPASDNFVADISALAEALIITEGDNPHWPDSARDLISGLLMHLKTWDGETATLPRMREILTLPLDQLQEELARVMANDQCPPARQRVGRFLGNASDEAQSVLSTAITQTSFLDDPAVARCLSGSDFSFASLKQDKATVFLILPSRYLTAYRRLLRLMMVSSLDALMTDTRGHDVLFIMDEFASLGHLKKVEDAMGLAAGYGIKLWAILQDINQVKAIYGNRWETFLANSGLIQFFTPNDQTTAEYLSNRVGTATIIVKGKSVSEVSTQQVRGGFTGEQFSEQQTARPVILPHEAYQLHPFTSVCCCAGIADHFLLYRGPYYKLPNFAGLYDRDPYHD